MKSTADKNEHNQITTNQMDGTRCLDDSDNTVITEVNDLACTGANDDTTEVKRGQSINITAAEVKGQPNTLVSDEENGEVNNSHKEGGSGVADGSTTPNGSLANGHLLMMEERHCCNGLNDASSSTANRRVLANVLTQHPPSSIVIELKNLSHVENGRLLSMEKNHHLSSTSPRSSPLVNGERETSTVPVNPRKVHSEPTLANGMQLNGGGSTGGGGDSHKTSVLLVDAMAENPTCHTEAESGSHSDKLDSVMASSIENADTGSRLPLGVDGLPCSLDPLQKRVRELELQHRREVAELRVSLKEAQQQV